MIKTTIFAKEIAAAIALKILLLAVLWFGILAPAERPPVDAKVVSNQWLSTHNTQRSPAPSAESSIK